MCSPPQFPSPFLLRGGGGQGFPFHKSEELQDGKPGFWLQKHTPPIPPSFRSSQIYPSNSAGDLQPWLPVAPRQNRISGGFAGIRHPWRMMETPCGQASATAASLQHLPAGMEGPRGPAGTGIPWE